MSHILRVMYYESYIMISKHAKHRRYDVLDDDLLRDIECSARGGKEK